MQINIKLTEEQQKAVVTSAIQTLTSRELANSLLSNLGVHDNLISTKAQNLFFALVEYLKEV